MINTKQGEEREHVAMDDMPVIGDIKFYSRKKEGSLVGFVDFRYEGKLGSIRIKGAGVHELKDRPKCYRLVYPRRSSDGALVLDAHPARRNVSKYIDFIITEHINAQLVKKW